jgi:hypothetical protein
MPRFKAYVVINLQYKIRICQHIDNNGTITITIVAIRFVNFSDLQKLPF